MTPRQRFESSYTVAESGCWEWHKLKDKQGYGRFYADGKYHKAHRYSYGKVPKGLVLDHLCRNVGCVNPDHLEAVTQRVNILRSDYRGTETHCKYGHKRRGVTGKCYDCTNERNRNRYATDKKYRNHKVNQSRIRKLIKS